MTEGAEKAATTNDSPVQVFNWDDLEREHVRPGVSRAGFRGDNVLLVMNWLKPGMETRPHSHPCEQLVYVVQGTMRFHVEDEVHDVATGGLLRIPPNAIHYGEPLGDEVVLNLDVFSPIRDDYRHLVAYQAATFE